MSLCAQAADNLPLYGVCCYMEEVVHRPPTILRGSNSPLPPLSRYLVSAPRCYCFLTHQPFFSLHFKAGSCAQQACPLKLGCLWPVHGLPCCMMMRANHVSHCMASTSPSGYAHPRRARCRLLLRDFCWQPHPGSGTPWSME